jgi:hypothetical protein
MFFVLRTLATLIVHTSLGKYRRGRFEYFSFFAIASVIHAETANIFPLQVGKLDNIYLFFENLSKMFSYFCGMPLYCKLFDWIGNQELVSHILFTYNK